MKKSLFLSLLLTTAWCCVPAGAMEPWVQQALEESTAQFQAVKESTDEVDQKLKQMEQALQEVYSRLNKKGKLSPAVAAKLRQVQAALRKDRAVLGKFSRYAGKTQNALDIALQAGELLQNAKNRAGGELGASMHILATAMEKLGEKIPVPLLGDAIAGYGTIALKMLNATDALQGTLVRKFNAGAVGTGQYARGSDPRYQALLKQFPELARSGGLLMPTSCPFIYRDQQALSGDDGYVWNAALGTWTKFNFRKTQPLQLLSKNLLAGKQSSPEQLLHMVDHFETYQAREKGATQLHGLLKSLQHWNRAGTIYPRLIDQLNRQGDYGWLSSAIRDPETFVSRWTYDPDFARKLNLGLQQMSDQLQQKGDPHNVLSWLANWSQKTGTPIQTKSVKPLITAVPKPDREDPTLRRIRERMDRLEALKKQQPDPGDLDDGEFRVIKPNPPKPLPPTPVSPPKGEIRWVIKHHYTGKKGIKSKTPYSVTSGKKHGTMTLYRSDGSRESITTFNHGVLNGPRIVYWSNGQSMAHYTYTNGKENGKRICHYENGQISKDFMVVNGVLSGDFKTWHKNGQIQNEGIHTNGLASSVKAYNAAGDLIYQRP